MQSKYPFDGLVELEDLGTQVLEGVVSHPAYYEFSEGVFMEIENREALIGERTGTSYAVVSDKYKAANHSHVIGSVIDTINQNFPGLRVEGQIVTDGNVMKLNMSFPDYAIDDNTTNGIQFGAFVNHRYDGRGALRGGIRMTRVICTNGMTMFANMKDGSFSIPHLSGFHGKMKNTIHLVTASIEMRERIELLVNSAIEDQYQHFTRDDLIYTISGIVGGQRVAKRIIEAAELNPTAFTRYDLYNEITRYAEHQPMSVNVAERLDVASEKVLSGAIPILHAPVLE